MLFTPERATAELGVSRTTLFTLLKTGEIRSILIGPQIRRIPRTEIEAYIERKLAEQQSHQAAS